MAADAAALAWFLVALHHHSQSVPCSARYGSREIVGWQMAHLFQQSRRASRQAPGRWLARFTALSEKARHGIEDAQAALLVHVARQRPRLPAVAREAVL